MPVTFPPGYVGSWPDATLDGPVVEADVDPAVLIAVALAYQAARYRLGSSAERAARDLWLRLRPVSSGTMARWIDAWDALLAAQQRQQAALTLAYIRATMSRFAVSVPTSVSFAADNPLWRELADWIDSPNASYLTPRLRRAIDAAQERAAAGAATIDDALLADRARSLHGPVVRARTALSEGTDFVGAIAGQAANVEDITDDITRGAERIIMDSQNWPRFQNGKAMLYKRETHGGACGWCVMVSTRLYSAQSAKQSAAWHAKCRCTWRPVSMAEATAYTKAWHASDGDYYAAGSKIGLWQGEAPSSWKSWLQQHRFDPVAAAQAGYTSTFTDPESGVTWLFDLASESYKPWVP